MNPSFKIYLIFLLPFFFTVKSQNVAYLEFTEKIELEADSLLAVDSYGFYYFLKGNSLLKTNFNQQFTYQNTVLGKPDALDTQNPLLLVLYYKKFNTVVLLDNQLNETTQINGNEHGLLIETVGLARQNSVWFYDSINSKFGLFNLKENTFRLISTFFPTEFKSVLATYNSFYWVTPKNEYYSIDYFGKISLLKILLEYTAIGFNSPIDFLLQNEAVFRLHRDNSVFEIDKSEKSYLNFCYTDGILAIFTHNLVTNYKIKLP